MVTCIAIAAPAVADAYGIERAIRLVNTARRLSVNEPNCYLRARCNLTELLLNVKAEHPHQSISLIDKLATQLPLLSTRERSVFHVCAGITHSLLGDYELSQSHHEKSLRFSKNENDALLTIIHQINVAQAMYLRGDISNALKILSKIEQCPNHVEALKGQIFADVGMLDEAIESLKAALLDGSLSPIFTENSGMQLVKAQLALGNQLDAANTARQLLETTVGNGRYRELLLHHSNINADSHSVTIDIETIKSLLNDALQRGNRIAAQHLSVDLSLKYLDAGLPHEANAALTSLADFNNSNTLAYKLDVLSARARLAWVRAQRELTSQFLDQALGLLQSNSSAGVGLDVAAAQGSHAATLANLHLEVALSSDQPGALLRVIESWRLATQWQSAPDMEHAPEDVKTALTNLRVVTTSQVDAAEDNVAAAREKVVQAIRRHPSSARTVSMTPITATQLREASSRLNHQVRIFFPRSETLNCLDPLTDQLRELGPKQAISELAVQLNQAVASASRGGPPAVRAMGERRVKDLADRLDDALGRPGDGTDRLLVVPHRDLFIVPWGVLPSLKNTAVTVSRSATQWHSQLHEHPDGPPKPYIGVGPHLTHGEQEAAAVAEAWAGSVVDPHATADAVRTALDEADLVHVTAHGLHHRSSPLFSQVTLHDGPLFGHDVVARRCHTKLLILSGCEVGGTSPRPLDHPLGLATAALYAGVKSVIAPVTPVADAATATLMATLHQGLAEGLSNAEALAKCDDSGSFVCFGSWVKVASP